MVISFFSEGFFADADKAISIELKNYAITEYLGDDPTGQILDVHEDDSQYSIYKCIVSLTDVRRLYVKLEFNIPY